MSLTLVTRLGQLDKTAIDAMARTIAEMAARNMRSGLGLGPTEAAKWVNTQMPDAQRLYKVELEKAADLMAALGTAQRDISYHTPNTWTIALGNWLGWRVVKPAACRPGFATNPVTRECVKIASDETIPDTSAWIPAQVPPDVPAESPPDLPAPEDKEKKSVFGIPVVPLIASVLVLLILRSLK